MILIKFCRFESLNSKGPSSPLQEEAISALEKFPTPASRLALTDILEQEQCFYKVRMHACFCLAKVCITFSDSGKQKQNNILCFLLKLVLIKAYWVPFWTESCAHLTTRMLFTLSFHCLGSITVTLTLRD